MADQLLVSEVDVFTVEGALGAELAVSEVDLFVVISDIPPPAPHRQKGQVHIAIGPFAVAVPP